MHDFVNDIKFWEDLYDKFDLDYLHKKRECLYAWSDFYRQTGQYKKIKIAEQQIAELSDWLDSVYEHDLGD